MVKVRILRFFLASGVTGKMVEVDRHELVELHSFGFSDTRILHYVITERKNGNPERARALNA